MANTHPIPRIPLRGDVEIPQLGFGVFQVPPEDTADVVTRALLAGYRHIDTAAGYRNEAGVGQAVHAAGLRRDEVFITTKLHNDDHLRAKDALKHSLSQLEMEHVDLYLIHWPVPAHDHYVQAWQALIEAQQEGLARAIGVSNFNQPHLERIIAETGVTPALNQVELHPRLQQPGLRRELADLGVPLEAWSPLAKAQVLEDPVITGIAGDHDRTPAQVVLRWHVQLGHIVIPKSVTQSRIEENMGIWDFQLTQDEMDAIEALDRGERTGPDPDTFIRPPA
jgi:2,5-diketo-D-gluconate reductase A